MNNSLLYRAGVAQARHPWRVLAAWVLILVIGGLFAEQLHGRLVGLNLTVPGTDSDRATQLVEERFAEPVTERDVLVFSSDRYTADDPQFREVANRAVADAREVPGIANVAGPYQPGGAEQISDDGHVALAVIGLTGEANNRQDVVVAVRAATDQAATEDVEVLLTGESPLFSDMLDEEEEGLRRAETIGLPLALLVLVLAFGSLVAAGLPLLLAVVGVTVSLGLLSLISYIHTFGILVESLATLIGLGVGIDYSLFVLARFREQLARGGDRVTAAGTALATTGKAIMFSGLTVALSLSGLYLVDNAVFGNAAISASLTVAVMVAVALSLLPALLGLLGARVNRLRVLPRRSLSSPAQGTRGGWARWAHVVMRRPVLALLASLIVLGTLAVPVFGLKLGIDTDTGLEDTPAGRGLAMVRQQFASGADAPMPVVVHSRDGALNAGDLSAVAALTQELRQHPDVARAESLTTLLDQATGEHSPEVLQRAAADPATREALAPVVNLDRGADTTVVTVISRQPPDEPSVSELVNDIRTTIAPEATAGTDLEVHVGGMSATMADLTDEVNRKQPWVVALVLGLSLVLLLLAFRSAILPLKAVAMNLLAVGASLGVLVAVAQEGIGTEALGFADIGFVQFYLPLVAFALLFGLSMDYEVLLVGRMREEWRRTGDNANAVADGLTHTGRPITSAAAIMVVVFASFMAVPITEMQQLGLVLAVAIFLDATIVRVVLVPATMRLVGRLNWWLPARLDRAVPRVSLGETTAPDAASTPTTPVEPVR